MNERSILQASSPRPSVLDPTHARPEPWFVGSGTGLMIGVLSLCAVLLVARGVSIWWMVQEARRWWREMPSAVRTPPLPPPPRPVAPLPKRAVPAPDPSKANQPLRGNPGAAFSDQSYPDAAIRANEQGRVVARLRVDETGTPVECRIVTFSGSIILDTATCRIALDRVRFDPARDGRGAAKVSYFTLPVTWRLPESDFPGATIFTRTFKPGS